MDPGRQECLRAIVAVLRASRRAGVIYLAEDGRRADSQYSWPWGVGEDDRALTLRLLMGQLDRVEGAHRLVYCEEGVPLRRGFATIWPERAGLFSYMPGHRAATAEEIFGPREVPAPPAEPDPPPEPPEPDDQADRLSEGCAAEIVKLLEDVGRRMTLMEIQEEFSIRKIQWSNTTVSHTAPAMRRAGRLTNRKRPDARGNGYGLPAWGPGD